MNFGNAESAAAGYTGLVERIAAGDADALDEIERADAAPFEVEERLRAAYEAASAADEASSAVARSTSTTAHSTSATPVRAAASCVLAPPTCRHRVLVAHSIEGRPLWSVVVLADDNPGSATIKEGPDAAAEVLLAALEDPSSRPVAPDPDAINQALAAARPRVAERIAALGLDGTLPHTSAGAIAARRLLTALAAVPGGPDTELCERADVVLGTIAQPHDAGTEGALRGAVADSDTRADGAGGVHALLDALERALGIGHSGGGGTVGSSGPGMEPPDPANTMSFGGARPLGTPNEWATNTNPSRPTAKLVGIIELRPARVDGDGRNV